MSAIDSLFSDLRSCNRKAFIPFVTAGDPNLAFTSDVLRLLDEQGCSLLEVGVPYSDPIADGPVIQASYTRALEHNVRVEEILESLKAVSSSLSAPMVSMVSYAIVHRYGLQRYIMQAKDAGLTGAIVPDLLVDESDEFSRICRSEDFSLIQLVTPTTPRDRALRIAESSTGFLYYVSVTGITGERNQLPAELTDNVSWLRDQTNLPICIGFGISSPEHVRAVAPVADGVIVGSAIVRRVALASTKSKAEVLSDVRAFVASLVDALHASE